MENIKLNCHCTALVSQIIMFKNNLQHSRCDENCDFYKKEVAYIKKLDKKLDELIKLLYDSP